MLETEQQQKKLAEAVVIARNRPMFNRFVNILQFTLDQYELIFIIIITKHQKLKLFSFILNRQQAPIATYTTEKLVWMK